MDTDLQESKRIGCSLMTRANKKLKEGKRQTDSHCIPEAISSFQECIELSTKAVFRFAGEEYPLKHRFSEDDFRRVLDRIDEYNRERFDPDTESLRPRVARLYVISVLWSTTYGYAKYGIPTLRAGAEEVFMGSEAKLAFEHACECYKTAQEVYGICGPVSFRNSHYTMQLPEPSFELESE